MAADPVRTQRRRQLRCSLVAALQMQEMILTHESIYIQVDQITTDPAGRFITVQGSVNDYINVYGPNDKNQISTMLS